MRLKIHSLIRHCRLLTLLHMTFHHHYRHQSHHHHHNLLKQELIMDEIPERDVTYHLTCLLIYHGTTTHLYSCFVFF